MALSTKQKAALTEFSNTQPALKTRGFLGSTEVDLDLGALLDNGQVLGNDFRDRIITVPIVLPAPTTGAATKDFPLWVAPFAGSIVGMTLYTSATWTDGANVGNKYLVSVRRYNNTAADVTFATDFESGLAAGVAGPVPSGASLAILTSGQNLTLAASSATLTMTNAVAWVNQPSPGDYISIQSTTTNFAGATPKNPGLYQVVTATTTVVTAKKLFGANPEAVSAAAAAAGDLTAIKLIKASEYAFVTGDMLGLRIIVPINTNTPTDLSGIPLLAQFRVRSA